ncbi:MAG: hypothetical protein WC641_06495 [Patescibacteria group bacterium]
MRLLKSSTRAPIKRRKSRKNAVRRAPRDFLLSRWFIVILAALSISLAVAKIVYAAGDCTLTTSGNWSTPGNWSCAAVPDSTSSVTIPDTMTATLSAESYAKAVTGSGAVNSLILGAFTLHVYGNFNVPLYDYSGANTVEFDGGVAQSLDNCAGFNNLTVAKSGETLSGETLTVPSTCVPGVTGNFNVNSGTILFNASTPVVLGSTTIASGTTVTTTGAAVMSFAGPVNNSGTISNETGNANFNGTLTNQIGGLINTQDGTFYFNGDVDNRGTINVGSGGLEINANFLNSGTFTSNNNAVNMSASGTTDLDIDGADFGNLSIAGNHDVRLRNSDAQALSLSVTSGTLNVADRNLNVGSGGTSIWKSCWGEGECRVGVVTSTSGNINLDGTVSVRGNLGTQTGNINTVDLQILSVGFLPPVVLGTLDVGSGVVSSTNSLSGGFQGAGVINGGSGTLIIGGAWATGFTFNKGSGTVRYTTSVAQTIYGYDYYNLEVLTANTATLDADATSTGSFSTASSTTFAIGNNTFVASGSGYNNLGTITLGSGRIIHPNDGAAITDAVGADVTTFTPPGSLYVTVTDKNRNLNGATLESLTVTVTTTVAAGADSETVTLAETGQATGIFRNTTPISIVAGTVATGNGTLEVLASGTLNTVYTDNIDSTDTGHDSASLVVTVVAESTSTYMSGGGAAAPIFLNTQPIAGAAQALGPYSIRWNFTPRTNRAVGHSIVDSATNRVMASSTDSSARYIDEFGLMPSTTYCRRLVRTSDMENLAATQTSAYFPCVTTASTTLPTSDFLTDPLSWTRAGRDLILKWTATSTSPGRYYGFFLPLLRLWLGAATALPGSYILSPRSLFQTIEQWGAQFRLINLDPNVDYLLRLMGADEPSGEGAQVWLFGTPRERYLFKFNTNMEMIRKTVRTLP